MAFARFNNGEGQASGVTAATANSGGLSGYSFDAVNGSPAFDSSQFFSGSLSYKFTLSAQVGAFTWNYPGAGLSGTLWHRTCLRMTSAVALINRLFSSGSSGSAGLASVTAAGKIQIQSGTNSAITATVLALDTWYQVETQYQWSSSLISGNVITLRLYSASMTLLETVSVTGSAVQAGPSVIYSGCSSAITGTFWFDNPAISDQGWIGTAASLPVAKANNLAGAANGVTLSTANSGGISGDAFDVANSAAASWLYPRAGGSPLTFVTTAGTQRVYWIIPGTSADVYTREYSMWPAPLGTGLNILGSTITTSASIVTGQAYFNTPSGTATKLVASVAGLSIVTGTYTYTPGNFYRVEGHLHVSATAGYFEVNVYDINGTLLEHLITGTTANTSAIFYAYFGQTSAVIQSVADLAVSDQGWIGAAANVPTMTSRKGSGFLDVMS